MLILKIDAMISQDFRSRHMLLVLHVWLLHRRLKGSPGQEAPPSRRKQAMLVQEALFDELWENTTIRIRQAGARLTNLL